MHRVFLFLILFIASLIRVANAASFEVTPYVVTGISHHSNLFLTANQEEAFDLLNTTNRSDTIFQLAPGARGDLEYKRQLFHFDLSVNRKEFDRFDSLNFTGGDASLKWDWLYTNLWEGIASYDYVKKLSRFNEQLSTQGDSNEINKLFVSANRILSPRYKLLSGLSYRTNDYKRRDNLSIDARRVQFGIRYTSLADNSVDFIFANKDSKYPNRNEQDLSQNLDDGFTDNSLLTKVRWQPSSKSALQFEVGYIDRQQDNISEDDFTGVIGNLAHHWSVSGKTKIISSIWRDIRDSEDQVSNFIESDGVSLELLWEVSPKISAIAQLEHEKRDFIANSRRGDNIGREDDVTNGLIGLNYTLRRNMVLSTQLGYESRDSNSPLSEYKNKIADLSLKIEF